MSEKKRFYDKIMKFINLHLRNISSYMKFIKLQKLKILNIGRHLYKYILTINDTFLHTHFAQIYS
jgi:hypothetical protein